MTRISQHTRPDTVDPALRAALTSCWVEVTNSGGAVGFPFPPVTVDDVRPAVDDLVTSLDASTRLLVAGRAEELAGWVVVARNHARVSAHWATVRRLQSAPAFRGRGVGRELMTRVREVARDEMGVEHLWLAVRGGLGLEEFYRGLGWVEAGRHPAALRLGDGDVRDEVFMVLPSL